MEFGWTAEQAAVRARVAEVAKPYRAVLLTIRALVRGAREDSVAEHITQPGMLYISMATETGSVYTLAELEALREVVPTVLGVGESVTP